MGRMSRSRLHPGIRPRSRVWSGRGPLSRPAAALLFTAAGAAALAVGLLPAESFAAASSAKAAVRGPAPAADTGNIANPADADLADTTAANTVAAAPGTANRAAAPDGAPTVGTPTTGTGPAAGNEPWQVNTGAAPDRTALFETFSPGGRIALRAGGPDHPPRLAPGLHLRGGAPAASAMHLSGPAANRINLVFVGDGYTRADQPVFDASAERAWRALTAYQPYRTYQRFFDAWRVNVVSPSGGISGDPDRGTQRATPLGMHFWCHGIDRLLCVDTRAASAYGDLFPHAISHVIALAHTTTYGGAGGMITTLAGENPESDAVIVHEMAHTIGGLGDEYQTNPAPAPEADPSAPANVDSAPQVEEMLAHRTKWYRWLGRPTPDGGVVGAYEGANYLDKGFYRPSPDSEMRTLGRPFNPPSVEALIKSFYVSRTGQGTIDPIDAVAPSPATAVTDLRQTLRAALIPLVGRGYTVYWSVDGVSVPGTLGRTSLPLARTPLHRGRWNRVTLWVIDGNPAVIDEAFRLRHMTKSRSWWVWGG